MDWIQEFYERQNTLSLIYTNSTIADYHHDKVKLIQKHHPEGKSVLELGAGGGQVACATSMAGYEVTAIELIPTFADHIQTLTRQYHQMIQVINADFYSVELNQTFDVITYWDGFGIGSDDEQIRLLDRCAKWLKPDGILLVDVYTPWYWANQHGRTMEFDNTRRRYEFDAFDCRMFDTWWDKDTPEDSVTQSLRCYSPADLKLILRDTELEFVDIVGTGGCVNETGIYEDHVNLNCAMSYTVKIKTAPS